ncbi:unnamed protein product [Peniophora sp. CBMAI 1063]|nr:unnamed protein product [Peniophora sp. CBMAI 1063]
MAPKSKSIFRQPGAQHFQLVHRSQRDPLIHDPDAPQHVLSPFTRSNDQRKGKSRADLESLLSPAELAARPNVGEASLYGIYYDDTEYDYMQHLRPVGVQEDGVESTLLTAPAPSQSKGKGKERAPIDLKEELGSALPSANEMPRNYESGAAVPSALAGFQPDMDPHLRQALEALEDDAFVDDDLVDDDGDDFFGELVKDGERGEGEDFEYEFDEYGVEEEVEHEELPEDASLEDRVAAFKRRQKSSAAAAPASVDEDDDFGSEGASTLGNLPTFSVIGGKKRRTGGSDASGFSMSSSAMARTESMRLLDDHFEVFEQKHYAEDADEEQDDEYIPDDEEDEAPDLIATREDFESMMNEFLDKFDVAGGKMKPVLEGDSTSKLDQIRTAMGRDERQKEDSDESDEDDEEAIYAMLEKEDKGERWDVESVLTTHTNLENHPRLIRARTSQPVPKITLDPRTGLPIVTPPTSAPTKRQRQPRAPSPPSSDTETETDHPKHQTVTRLKNESKEDKKARKAAVKEQKSARRQEKKATKVAFGNAVRKEIGVVASHSVKTRKL